KNQIYDSNEFICSKKSIGTQTDPEKDINSNSFSIIDGEIVFDEADRKLSPIIENHLIPSEKIKINSPFLTENYKNSGKDIDKSFEIIRSNKEKVKFLHIQKSKSLSNIKLNNETQYNNNYNKNNVNDINNNIKNIKKSSLENSNNTNKRSSILSNSENNNKISDEYNSNSKRNSILSNIDDINKNSVVSFSIKSRKLKKENSNISKLISLFENDGTNESKIPISKSDEYINNNKIGSIKDRINRFSNSSLDNDNNTSSRFSLLDDNYDFEGDNIGVIKFQSTDQLKLSENEDKENDKTESEKNVIDSQNIIKDDSNLISNNKNKKSMSIQEMDDKISRILIDTDIFNLNKAKTASNRSSNEFSLSDYDLKDVGTIDDNMMKSDDYENIGFISSPFTSIPGIENVTRAMVGTWVKKLNRLKLYSKNRYLILHPFINAVSWSKYGPFSEPKRIRSEYVLEVKTKTNRTNDHMLVIKAKTGREIIIKFNSESEFIIWANAFNVLSKYKEELKAFRNIQRTSCTSPIRTKHFSLLSYIGVGLMKKVNLQN
ncbi:hypothetical protein U3516DRAFT_543748, partial [Neocallimastix sp. 'constans']